MSVELERPIRGSPYNTMHPTVALSPQTPCLQEVACKPRSTQDLRSVSRGNFYMIMVSVRRNRYI